MTLQRQGLQRSTFYWPTGLVNLKIHLPEGNVTSLRYFPKNTEGEKRICDSHSGSHFHSYSQAKTGTTWHCRWWDSSGFFSGDQKCFTTFGLTATLLQKAKLWLAQRVGDFFFYILIYPEVFLPTSATLNLAKTDGHFCNPESGHLIPILGLLWLRWCALSRQGAGRLHPPASSRRGSSSCKVPRGRAGDGAEHGYLPASTGLYQHLMHNTAA